jgi:hypothetical protein
MNTTSELDANKVDKMRERFIESMRGTPPPQKTAEQMLIDRIKSLEMDMRESSELNEHLREHIKRLEEAGDEALHHALHQREDVGLEIWNAAKEAKP